MPGSEARSLILVSLYPAGEIEPTRQVAQSASWWQRPFVEPSTVTLGGNETMAAAPIARLGPLLVMRSPHGGAFCSSQEADGATISTGSFYRFTDRPR